MSQQANTCTARVALLTRLAISTQTLQNFENTGAQCSHFAFFSRDFESPSDATMSFPFVFETRMDMAGRMEISA
jgi:hypothetical protein